MALGSRSFTLLLVCLLGAATLARAQEQGETVRIELETRDGKQIFAFWQEGGLPATAPVVLLVHNPGATHAGWQPLLEPLHSAGFRTLALDLRGHGDSRETTPEVYEAMRRRDPQPYQDMIHDIEAGVRWLTSVQKLPAERIALVGCEYTANLVLLAATRTPKIGAVVALSPSENYFAFPLVETARKFGKRPLYFILPKQLLGEGASRVEKLMTDNRNFEMKVFPRYDHHGVFMLGLSWDVEGLITSWLEGIFGFKKS